MHEPCAERLDQLHSRLMLSNCPANATRQAEINSANIAGDRRRSVRARGNESGSCAFIEAKTTPQSPKKRSRFTRRIRAVHGSCQRHAASADIERPAAGSLHPAAGATQAPSKKNPPRLMTGAGVGRDFSPSGRRYMSFGSSRSAVFRSIPLISTGSAKSAWAGSAAISLCT